MDTRYRWAWLPALVVGVGLFLAVLRTLQDTGNPNLVPALILLGAVVVPITFVVFVYGRGMTVDVPGGAVAVTAVVAGVVGVVIAGSVEYDAARRFGMASVVLVGVIEEAAKLAVPVVLALVVRHRWRAPADGLVLGVAAGAGFAVLETMGYAFVTLVRSGGRVDAVVGILLLRGLLSPAAHLAWTGLTVSALWWARARGGRGRSLLLFAGTYVVAVVLHSFWDLAGSVWVDGAVAVVSLLLLFAVAHRIGHAQVRARLAPPADHPPLAARA